MARQRDFAREYARRLSLGLERGETRQQARGKRTGPEHPVRALSDPERWIDYIRRNLGTMEALVDTLEGARRLGKVNAERLAAGKAPLKIGRPPLAGPGLRQGTEEALEDAERHTEGIPDPYRVIYVWEGGWTWQIERATRRRGKRAA